MSKAAKILAIILITFGGVFTLVGVSSYLTVGNVLTAQAITVADDASCLAGATVNNPLAAWCQQDIITITPSMPRMGCHTHRWTVRTRYARLL